MDPINIVPHDACFARSGPSARHCPFIKFLLPRQLTSHLGDTQQGKIIYNMTAKTRAIPSLHRDSYVDPLTRGAMILPGDCVG